MKSLILGILGCSLMGCEQAFESATTISSVAEISSNEVSTTPILQNELPEEVPGVQEPAPVTTPAVCRAPRHYRYVVPVETALACVENGFRNIFSVNIPDRGRAIVKSTFSYRNSNADTIFFWASYALVGATTVAGQVGDDICPGTVARDKTVLAAGLLSDSNSTVQVYAGQGANPCVNDQVYAIAGGTIDIWVEDPAAHCQGLDIGAVHRADRYNWTTSMTEISSLMIPPTGNRASVRVLSSVEGTPEVNPNVICGAPMGATLVAQVVLGSTVVTQQAEIPASMGNGHLVLDPSFRIPYSPTLTKARLYVGSNTAATTIFSGGPTSGGSVLAFVKE